MEQGRSRIAFERGRVGIHSLSAAAIEEVAISDGKQKPIRISIRMNNPPGIYQVDGLLKAKLRGSGLEPYVEVLAHIDTEAEKRLVPLYELELELGYNSPALRVRLMVGRPTLNPVSYVRVLVPQLRNPAANGGFLFADSATTS